MRVDLLLVKKKIAASRTLAQEMIKSSQVYVVINDKKKRLVTKSSEELEDDIIFEIVSGFATEFVSRAGHKIKGVAEKLNLNLKDKVCLDVGVSTGGFSDFLLRSNALTVIGVDVGQNQTQAAIKNHPRFMLFEKVNARYLDENVLFCAQIPKNGFDFICMDVSFISVRLILPKLRPLLGKNGELLVLIKPQFELGPNALNEKGIVKDSSQYLELERVMIEEVKRMGFIVKKYLSSPIKGKEGNKEFFIFLGV